MLKNKFIASSFLTGLLSGSGYFFITNENMNFLGMNIYLWFALSALIGAFTLMVFLKKSPAKVALYLTLGAETAIILSIATDLFSDSTSHNMFPFEIIFSGIAIFLSAMVGAFLGKLFLHLKAKSAAPLS